MYLFLRYICVVLLLLSSLCAKSQKDTIQNYDQYQDSLRCVLKQVKDDKSFSNPFLEELYLRDLYSVKGDSVIFLIPFDSHSNDCGAPDCYTTEVSFVLPYTDPIILVDSLKITYSDIGCTNEFITPSTSYFYLIYKGKDIIIYYNWYQRASLVLFSEQGKKRSSSYAFFIEDIDRSSLLVGRFMIKDYEKDDEHNIYPYTSTKLRREYECFITDN